MKDFAKTFSGVNVKMAKTAQAPGGERSCFVSRETRQGFGLPSLRLFP
ncbi:hypothetical protein [uncultured Rhodoblastus sp.]|nr:hypothetical protein [uncultured Rhodoblastus sp.]